MTNQQEHFVRHGGVHYILNVPEHQVRQYVDQLPEEKRSSLFEVMQDLKNKGWITIVNDGVFADGEGKIGGSDDC